MYNGWGGGGAWMRARRACRLRQGACAFAHCDCVRAFLPLSFSRDPSLASRHTTEPHRAKAARSRRVPRSPPTGGSGSVGAPRPGGDICAAATLYTPSPSPAPHQPLPVSARGCCRTLAPSGCMTGAPARRGSVAAAHTRPEPPHGIPRSGLRNLDRWLSLKGGKCAPGDMNHAGLLADLENVSKIDDTKVWSPRRAFQSLAAAPACPPTAEVMRPAGTGRPTAGPPHRLGCPRLERLGSPELPGAGPAVGRGCRCRVGSVGGRRTRRGASLSGWELSCRGGRQGGAGGGGPAVVEHFVP